jgi:holo-[acyl-carrier protein] synthase
MLGGIGVDLFAIERIERELERDGRNFASQVFTPQEIAECEAERRPAAHYAIRFAAKEALFKALGDRPRGVSWRDAELRARSRGRYAFVLHDEVARAVAEKGCVEVFVSVARTARWAAAFVVVAPSGAQPEEIRA